MDNTFEHGMPDPVCPDAYADRTDGTGGMIRAVETDERVEESTEKLLQIIKTSRTYREYAAARKELSAFPDRKEKADRFRRDNYIVRNNEADDLTEARADLYRRREQLRMDPLIDRYLNAELLMCRMLKRSAVRILNAADLDLEGMEDIL